MTLFENLAAGLIRDLSCLFPPPYHPRPVPSNKPPPPGAAGATKRGIRPRAPPPLCQPNTSNQERLKRYIKRRLILDQPPERPADVSTVFDVVPLVCQYPLSRQIQR